MGERDGRTERGADMSARQPSALIQRYRSGTARRLARPWMLRQRPTVRVMYVIHLTDAELEMARHALRAYLLAFGHDEAATVGEIRRVIAKLHAAQTEGEDPRVSA